MIAGVPNAASISVVGSGRMDLQYKDELVRSCRRVLLRCMKGSWQVIKGYRRRIIKMWVDLGRRCWIMGEFEANKLKIRVFHTNQHIRQQVWFFFLFFVESLFLEDWWDVFFRFVFTDCWPCRLSFGRSEERYSGARFFTQLINPPYRSIVFLRNEDILLDEFLVSI